MSAAYAVAAWVFTAEIGEMSLGLSVVLIAAWARGHVALFRTWLPLAAGLHTPEFGGGMVDVDACMETATQGAGV